MCLVQGRRLEVKKKSSAVGVFIQIPTIAYRFWFAELFKRHASCATADKANHIIQVWGYFV